MSENRPSVSVGDLQLGANVYGSDGTHIGDVNQVVNDPSIAELYFEVDQGGVLGFGGKTFYVPFSAIARVGPGLKVSLSCTGQQAEKEYAHKPGR